MVNETVRAGAEHRTEVRVWLGLGLLLGALSALILIPQAQHLRSLRDGVRTDAVMRTRGTCALGQCKVAFEVQDRTVVAALPPGSGGSKYPVGAHLTVRYRADDPQTVAAASDAGGRCGGRASGLDQRERRVVPASAGHDDGGSSTAAADGVQRR
ncbi:hypothetical protein [Streptomyces sp. NPDC049813]|uniref:hypothetical protein n=1 Tax=Streptomyces sp. NPDC049813 TaxID=3365597 RepID=UPI0037B4D754